MVNRSQLVILVVMSTTFAALTTGYVLWMVVGYFRQQRRRRRAWCVRCSYALTGLSGTICPECGVNQSEVPRRPLRRRAIRIGVLALGLIGTLLPIAFHPMSLPWMPTSLVIYRALQHPYWRRPEMIELDKRYDTLTLAERRLISSRLYDKVDVHHVLHSLTNEGGQLNILVRASVFQLCVRRRLVVHIDDWTGSTRVLQADTAMMTESLDIPADRGQIVLELIEEGDVIWSHSYGQVKLLAAEPEPP